MNNIFDMHTQEDIDQTNLMLQRLAEAAAEERVELLWSEMQAQRRRRLTLASALPLSTAPEDAANCALLAIQGVAA